MDLAPAPLKPHLNWGMLASSMRSRALSTAAGGWTLGRRSAASCAAGLSRRGCCCWRREDRSFGTSKLSVRARIPVLYESCPNHLRARRDCLMLVRAEKDENGAEETPDVANLGQPIIIKKSALLTSLDFWLQVAIFVFAAGFVDAGFSRDWSRIGVLSRQTEEELQMAAVGVVPLAATLIWSISQRRKKL